MMLRASPARNEPVIFSRRNSQLASVTKIGRDFYGRNGHQTDARILNFPFKDLTDLYSKLLLDPADSSFLDFLYDLDVALNHALWGQAFGLFSRFPQHAFKKAFIGPNRHDAKLRTLPQILMVNLGN